MTTTMPRTTSSYLVWGAAALLLCVPAVAMRFTPEVNWTGVDFAVAGTMLAAAAGGYDYLSRRSDRLAYRLGAGLAAASCLFLLWVNLAVGIIGAETNPANWMYVGVLATPVLGAVRARFQPSGMVRAMLATAVAQVLAAVVALAFNLGAEGPAWPRDVIGVTALLTTAWLASAALFARAR